ncbi:MAG: caspase family protein, partial [Muribaculaceae bacterium]|nr:caspase family protein [Muribaculaceae bacterium]
MEISQQRAFQEVSKLFEGKDVDYYSITPSGGSSTSEWLFFVDAMPDALWSHPCYVVSYPKNISTSEIAPAPQSQELSFPPEEYDYQPYQVKDRHEDEPMEAVGEPEYFPLSRSSNNSSADRTYALIVGGSPQKQVNETADLFFNDCSFFYKTLVNRYNVPKQNIVPLLYYGNGRCPSKKDLDGDGINDIEDRVNDATISNIDKQLKYMSDALNKNDNLIVYIISHGTDPKHNKECLLYIAEEFLSADDFIPRIEPILAKGVNVTVVIGACYSANFVEKINNKGCVGIASAIGVAKMDTSSGRSVFLRYWAGAINRADYYNNKINADYNNDGYISFKEAFDYAAKKLEDFVFDQYYRQVPYFQSTPEHLIEQLAIDRVPADINIQPYSDSYDEEKGIYWNSPDIWLRRENDNKTDYQNVPTSNKTWIKVRVRNNGDMSSGEGKILRLYWAQASTVVASGMCKGNYLFKDEEPVGGHIADISIDNINPNANKIYSVNWSVPRELIQTGTRPDSHQFSIYAALVDDTEADADPVFEIGKFTNTAMSTFSAIEKTDTLRTSTMFFYNPLSEQKGYKLKINWRDDYSKDLFRYANVVVDMSPTVYRSWERGGKAAIAVVDNGYSPYAAQM